MPTNEQVLSEIGKQSDNGLNVIRGAIHKKGNEVVSQGKMAENLPEIGDDFKFNEGSVSKVRLGFLGYALDQDENASFKLNDKAANVFGSNEFKKYLNDRYAAKYGEERVGALGNFIDNLFTQGSEEATLGDLLTHRAGVGDLTRDQLKLFEKDGIDKQYSLVDLLLVEQLEDGVKRTNGKPHSQDKPDVANNELPEGKYEAHQYSNLSYMLAGLAIEYKTGQPLHELHNEYFLHPIKGRAAGREDLALNNTIPQGVDLVDAPKMPTYDHKSKTVVDGTKFNGANAAGGFVTTADDLVKFMEQGFKGFPGTKEYNDREANPNQNPYFTDTTIDEIMAEGKKFGIAGTNQEAGTVDYQMSGFVTTIKVPEGLLHIPSLKAGEALESFKPTPEQLKKIFHPDNIIKYAKAGEIVGAKTFAEFNPKEGIAEVSVFLKENVTPQINSLKNSELLSDKNLAQSLTSQMKDFGIESENYAAQPKIIFSESLKDSLDDLVDSLRGNITEPLEKEQEYDDNLTKESTKLGDETKPIENYMAADNKDRPIIGPATTALAKKDDILQEYNLSNGGKQFTRSGGGRS